jgi:hypothetical protein
MAKLQPGRRNFFVLWIVCRDQQMSDFQEIYEKYSRDILIIAPIYISGNRRRRTNCFMWPQCELLELVLFHKVAERAVGDAENVGGADLDSVGLTESGLQERALNLGNIIFHVHAFR